MFEIMKIREVAKELKIPESTIRTWKRRGEIPKNCFLKIGGTIFIRIKNFREWLEKDA